MSKTQTPRKGKSLPCLLTGLHRSLTWRTGNAGASLLWVSARGWILSLNPQTLTQKMGDVVGTVRVSLHVGCAPYCLQDGGPNSRPLGVLMAGSSQLSPSLGRPPLDFGSLQPPTADSLTRAVRDRPFCPGAGQLHGATQLQNSLWDCTPVPLPPLPSANLLPTKLRLRSVSQEPGWQQ